jgi:hypothetical protein
MQSPLERLQTRRPARERTLKQLNIVRVVAVLDALLLVPLVYAALTDAEGAVDVLGPLHGVGFLILVALTARGAVGRLWGWWFPALVVVTLGPPGSFIGDVRIRRGARRSSG